MKNTTKKHFLPGTLVDVVFCDLTSSWLRGTVLGHTKTGVVTKLSTGLVVTRTPDRVKHVETCGFCCTVKV